MKTNQKMIFKLTTLIAVIFFSLSTAFAELGVIDIVMGDADNEELMQVQVEQHKLYSIVLIKESGEKFEKTICLNGRSSKVNFTIPRGFYKVLIVELETGFAQKYTANLQ